MSEQLISMTPAAAARARELLTTRGDGAVGIRLAVKPTGCSGYSYLLDFVREVRADDAVVDAEGVRIVMDPKAVELIAGTEMDFVTDRLGAQFVFNNPREKARCGCGESFSV
jgi:iron-sulfur cluster assembly protein